MTVMGWNKTDQTTNKSLIYCSFHIWRWFGKYEIECTGKAEIQAAAKKACEAIVWPTPGLKEGSFDRALLDPQQRGP